MPSSAQPSLALAAFLSFSPAVASAAALATPLEGALPSRPQHARGTGTISYATAGRAYLDVGASDGLAPGATVVARGRGEHARCVLDLVAEYASSCPSTALRAGDAVSFHAGPAPAEPKLLPALASEEDLAHRGVLLQAAPAPPLVEFKGAPGQAPQLVTELRRAQRVSAQASYARWESTDASGLGAATLDLALSGVELGRGVRADVLARAERWIPPASTRFRSGDDTRFYLWQAQLTAPISRATIAAGRVLPYAIPGATVFDGGSASYHAGPAELGVFGGLVPQPDTLAPTADRATGGAFWSLSRAFEGGGGLRQDGRIAVVRSPELGTRLEATLAAGGWWKAAYASGEAQLGFGGNGQAAGNVDAARVDLSAQLARGVSLGGGFRHDGLDWPALPGASAEPAVFPGRSDAASAWASWDVWMLRVAANGGFSRDQANGPLQRRWAGPEVGIPRLLGRWGGVSAGYLEERGWIEGRSAWGQLALQPGSRYRLVARATWTHTSSAVVDVDEVGVLASASAELGHGFGIRASVLARTTVTLDEGAGSPPVGITGLASLWAGF